MTFTLITDTNRKATFKWVLFIWYLIWFHQIIKKDKDKNMRALINLSSEVNIVHSTYVTKLGLHAKKIDVGEQKIDGSYLNTFKIVIANYLVKNKL